MSVNRKVYRFIQPNGRIHHVIDIPDDEVEEFIAYIKSKIKKLEPKHKFIKPKGKK